MTEQAPQQQGGEPIGYNGPTMVDRDAEHLRMLSIFWYVWTGLSALFGTIPVIHLVIGIIFLVSPPPTRPGEPPMRFFGAMFAIMGGCFVLLGWTNAILAFLTARSLKERRRQTLCYVAAALACLQMPLGTVLGIFTFIVLSRPSVKGSFR